MAARSSPSRRGDGGVSLVGLLVTLVILAVMALAVVRLTQSHSPGTPSAERAPTAAARAVCQAAVTALDQAVSAYQALNGGPPPPGRAWAVTTAAGGPWVQSWPGIAHEFTITWNGHRFAVTTPHGPGCEHA